MLLAAACMASFFTARTPDTVAHRTLPFNTHLRITALHTGRQTIAVVKDRGPFIRGRCIDVSRQKAAALGMIGSGVAPVRIEIID